MSPEHRGAWRSTAAKRRALVVGAAALFLVGAATHDGPPTEPRGSVPGPAPDSVFTQEWTAMGTVFRVELITDGRQTADFAIQAVRDEVERVEQLLSDYRETSEFNRISRLGVVTVDPETFSLFGRLGRLVADTNGAFDPSVGSLVDAWGFRRGVPAVPGDRDLAEARSRSGWHRVRLDPSRRVVATGGVRLDPGGFGKGYALDRARLVLDTHGIRSALLDAGGSTFLALDPPPGLAGWSVRLAPRAQEADSRSPVPESSGDPASVTAARPDTLLLAREALSVSGQSGRSFRVGDAVYGHIIDPRTGRPASAGLRVVVRTDSALEADALSTALYVLGPEAAGPVLARFPSARARFLPGPGHP